MIFDSGLLFWATLYVHVKNIFHDEHTRSLFSAVGVWFRAGEEVKIAGVTRSMRVTLTCLYKSRWNSNHSHFV